MTDTSTVTVTGLRHQVTDIPVMTTTALAQRADDAADVRQAADLLYDATDPAGCPMARRAGTRPAAFARAELCRLA
jgi:hypothetical protein